MNFENPEYLFLLWLPLLIAIIAYVQHEKTRVRQGLFGKSGGRSVFWLQLIFCTLGLIFCIVALARPWWGMREEKVTTASRNVLLLLDVSRSMLAEDIQPSRLERAKADLTDLVNALQGDRVALMAFRNGSALLCPFTTDLAFVRTALDGVTIDSAPRGETHLGKALEAALAAFKELESDHNAILLLSDGEDLSGRGLEIAKKCAEKKIPIFCIGIGEQSGASIPVGATGDVLRYKNEEVVTKLDSRTLIAISNTSGGAYLPIESTAHISLGELYNRHVKAIVQQETAEQLHRQRVSRYGLFLLPGLTLFLLAGFLSRGRPMSKRKGRPIKVAALLLPAFLFVFPLSSFADEARDPSDLARQARRADVKGNTTAARKLYSEALSSSQKLSPEKEEKIRLNAALSALDDSDPAAVLDILHGVSSPAAQELRGIALLRQAEVEAQTALEKATNAQQRASALQKKADALDRSALAFRSALSSQSGQSTTNFLAVLNALHAATDAATQAKFAAEIEGKALPELLEKLFTEERKICVEARSAFKETTPQKISRLEALADKQENTAMLWAPVVQQLLPEFEKSITNQTELALIQTQLRGISEAAAESVEALKDLNPDALGVLSDSHDIGFHLYLQMADPRKVLDYSITSQSNALARAVEDTKYHSPIMSQAEARKLFTLFSMRLPALLDQLEQQQTQQKPNEVVSEPGFIPTGMPLAEGLKRAEQPVTKQSNKRAEIERLTRETQDLHIILAKAAEEHLMYQILPKAQLANAKQAVENMVKIRELLQDDQQQQQNKNQDQKQEKNQNQQQQNQQQQDSQEQNKQEEQQKQQEQNQDAQQQDSEEQQPQEATSEEQKAQDAPQNEVKSAEEQAARELMEKILRQEQERAAEKRKRKSERRPKVDERDW